MVEQPNPHQISHSRFKKEALPDRLTGPAEFPLISALSG
jgi:hypothetical protein